MIPHYDVYTERSTCRSRSVDDDWLSVQEAADRCGITYRTVYRMVEQGERPAETPDGRPWRLRRADVDAFIERSRVQPGELSHLTPPRISSRGKADS